MSSTSINTESRLFNFIEQFFISYNEIKLKQPRLNTEDLLEIIAKSLDSTVAFIAIPLPKSSKRFKISCLYKDGDANVNLSIDTEFEFTTETLGRIQAGSPVSWEEEGVPRNLPDIHGKGIKNLFVIKFMGNSGAEILVVGNRRKRHEETYYYLSKEALFAKFFIETTGTESFKEHLQDYMKARLRGYRSELLSEIDKILYCESYLTKQNVFDKFLFKYIDLAVSLQIRPSENLDGSNIRSLSDLYQKIMSAHDEMVLPKIALLRAFSWLSYKKSIAEEEIEYAKKINEMINGISDNLIFQLLDTWEPMDPDIPIEGRAHDLGENIVRSYEEFYLRNRFAIEYIRSQLFMIYVECMKQKGIANRNVLEIIKDRMNSGRRIDILRRLKPILWTYLSKCEYDGRLTINSDWLRCYLGIKILDSKCLNEYLTEGRYSPEETISFFRHLSTYLLFIIHCVRNHGNPAFLKFSDSEQGFEDVIESQIYLISEFAHVDGKLSREIRLFENTLKIWSSEAILYVVSDAYREHLQHALDCCILGLMLLDIGLVEKLCPDHSPPLNEARLRNWILIGLLHDSGYSLDICHRVIKHIAFLKSPQLNEFRTKLQAYLEELELGLLQVIRLLPPFEKVKHKLTHEITSSLNLLYLKRSGEEAPDKLWMSEIEPALRAVQAHHSRETTIDPSNEPLSFLLLLCDQLQEWDRPRINSLGLRKYVFVQLLRPERKELDENAFLKQVRVNLGIKMEGNECKDNECRLEWKTNKLFFELSFMDAGLQDFEPAVIWAEKCFNFEILKTSSMNVDIEIGMKHPIPENFVAERLNFTEMDLFQSYIREDEEASSLSEWLVHSRLKQNGLQYVCDRNFEEYSINLQAFNRKPEKMIYLLPKDLYTTFSQWKKTYIREAKLRDFKT